MNTKAQILVVDDDEKILNFFKRFFKNENFNVTYSNSGTRALKLIKSTYFDLILADLKIDEFNGIDLLKEVMRTTHDTEVIIITGYGTIESAVEVMQLGAYDYLTKPLDITKTKITINKALERKKLRTQVNQLKNEIERQYINQGIVIVSESMRRILHLVETIAPTDSTVLITGESGVGKEVIVKYIHRLSPRAPKPFISINCATLPETLLESELFGYVRGAFTGAVSDKVGLFEEAHEGTIFLDEIGELTPGVQAKLLRALQEGEIRKLGDTKSLKVNVRIIAATNKNLAEQVKEKKFREDLYYRLNVIPITIPPLRERKEDIIPLFNHFMKKISEKMEKNITGLTPEAIYQIKNYHWPGNIRELENVVERLVTITENEIITEREVSYVFMLDKSANQYFETTITDNPLQENDPERNHIIDALKRSGWSIQKAAKILGISRTTLWRKMKKYSIEIPR